ncbi:MAG TPA: hypothetical protein VK845_08550 [Gemmatimonadales bacterium]|nr:hypothetical protein [Gemmatimonadales bacterium]
MNTTQAGIDIAEAVFEVALSDSPGTVRERQRLSRERGYGSSSVPTSKTWPARYLKQPRS